MPLKVGCRCGKWFAAPDHLAGSTVPCPACGSPIVIQASGAPAAATAPRQAPTAPRQATSGGVVVTCTCGQSYKAPESVRGQTLPCPACGTAVHIPAPAGPAPAASASPAGSSLGLGPLGANDPLADPLMTATLSGTPLGGFPATDPLGRPTMSGAYGSRALGRPMAQSTQEGPNWVLLGSIGGVALVLLVLFGAVVVVSLSGGGNTPIAANSTPSGNQTPTAPTATPGAAPTVP